MATLTKQEKLLFNKLVLEARQCEKDDDLEQSLKLYRDACNIVVDDRKLQAKIRKLSLRLSIGDNENISHIGNQTGKSMNEDAAMTPSIMTNASMPGSRLTESLGAIDTAVTPVAQPARLEDPDELGFQRNTRTGNYQLDGRFVVPGRIYDALYPYQRTGVRWLWNLHEAGMGGILGDDMGLGKTVQVAAFVAAAMYSGVISHALIVLPVSVVQNWAKEFKKWSPDINVTLFHGSSIAKRNTALEETVRRGGVCLTTYGMIYPNLERLTTGASKCKWDYIILDEGHKLKNHNIQISKAMRQIPCSQRVILSGTPIQNNLQELWSLFDFVCKGRLLGDPSEFKLEFSDPIMRGRDKGASDDTKRLGEGVLALLRERIAPYFLRRTKAEVLSTKSNDDQDGAVKEEASGENSETASGPSGKVMRNATLPPKYDFIVWCQLTSLQIGIYRRFLQSETVQRVLNRTQSPFGALSVIRKICNHPLLLQTGTTFADTIHEEAAYADDWEISPSLKVPMAELSPQQLCAMSAKLDVLTKLVNELNRGGHRTLIFSQSVQVLNIIQKCLRGYNISHLRLDGSVAKTSDRQALIEKFQSDDSIRCFILTTQVGGLGITLTAADRVIIFDSSWNPAQEAQAVERAYRIGQTKPVIVYRLSTCATIEEKVFRNQIFKGGLINATTGSAEGQYRYFSFRDLRQVFSLNDPEHSETHAQLEAVHGHNREYPASVRAHLNYLETLSVDGVSDHQMLFSLPASAKAQGRDDGAEEEEGTQGERIRIDLTGDGDTFVPSASPVQVSSPRQGVDGNVDGAPRAGKPSHVSTPAAAKRVPPVTPFSGARAKSRLSLSGLAPRDWREHGTGAREVATAPRPAARPGPTTSKRETHGDDKPLSVVGNVDATYDIMQQFESIQLGDTDTSSSAVVSDHQQDVSDLHAQFAGLNVGAASSPSMAASASPVPSPPAVADLSVSLDQSKHSTPRMEALSVTNTTPAAAITNTSQYVEDESFASAVDSWATPSARPVIPSHVMDHPSPTASGDAVRAPSQTPMTLAEEAALLFNSSSDESGATYSSSVRGTTTTPIADTNVSSFATPNEGGSVEANKTPATAAVYTPASHLGASPANSSMMQSFATAMSTPPPDTTALSPAEVSVTRPMQPAFSPAAEIPVKMACPEHKAACVYPIEKCRCYCTDAETARYAEHIAAADAVALELGSEHRDAVLDHLLSALGICDDDVNLHNRIIQIGTALDMWSKIST